MTKAIKLFYSKRRNGAVNFGDDISPMLVAHLTGRNVVHARVSGCDMAAIGSIIEMIAERRLKRILHGRFSPIKIWGSGCLLPGGPISGTFMKPLALRGPLTAARLGCPELPLGDRGLLFDRLFAPTGKKKFKWGLVAHYSDVNAAGVEHLLENTKNIVNIPVDGPPLDTLRLISECEFIASSSLHGLIAADCYRIPNLRIKLGARLEATNNKFLDYAASIERQDISEVPVSIAGNLDDEMRRLEASFTYFENIDRVSGRLERALLDGL